MKLRPSLFFFFFCFGSHGGKVEPTVQSGFCTIAINHIFPTINCQKPDISYSSLDSSSQKKTRKMHIHAHIHNHKLSAPQILYNSHHPLKNFRVVSALKLKQIPNVALKNRKRKTPPLFAKKTSKYSAISASLSPLDLTEDNIKQVLADARVEA